MHAPGELLREGTDRARRHLLNPRHLLKPNPSPNPSLNPSPSPSPNPNPNPIANP